MALYQCLWKGNLTEVVEAFEREFIDKSDNEKVNEKVSTFADVRMCVYNLERYGALSSNRLALTVSMVESKGEVLVTATSAGGSAGVFFKVNTWSENYYVEDVQEWAQKFLAAHPHIEQIREEYEPST